MDNSTTHIVMSTWELVVAKECVCPWCLFRLSSTVKCMSWDWLTASLMSKCPVSEVYFRFHLDDGIQFVVEQWKLKNGHIGHDDKWFYEPEKCPPIDDIVDLNAKTHSQASRVGSSYNEQFCFVSYMFKLTVLQFPIFVLQFDKWLNFDSHIYRFFSVQF